MSASLLNPLTSLSTSHRIVRSQAMRHTDITRVSYQGPRDQGFWGPNQSDNGFAQNSEICARNRVGWRKEQIVALLP